MSDRGSGRDGGIDFEMEYIDITPSGSDDRRSEESLFVQGNGESADDAIRINDSNNAQVEHALELAASEIQKEDDSSEKSENSDDGEDAGADAEDNRHNGEEAPSEVSEDPAMPLLSDTVENDDASGHNMHPDTSHNLEFGNIDSGEGLDEGLMESEAQEYPNPGCADTCKPRYDAMRQRYYNRTARLECALREIRRLKAELKKANATIARLQAEMARVRYGGGKRTTKVTTYALYPRKL
jgi:hypothetical protein